LTNHDFIAFLIADSQLWWNCTVYSSNFLSCQGILKKYPKYFEVYTEVQRKVYWLNPLLKKHLLSNIYCTLWWKIQQRKLTYF